MSELIAARSLYLASVRTVLIEAAALRRYYGNVRPDCPWSARWFDMHLRLYREAIADMETCATTMEAHDVACRWGPYPATERTAA